VITGTDTDVAVDVAFLDGRGEVVAQRRIYSGVWSKLELPARTTHVLAVPEGNYLPVVWRPANVASAEVTLDAMHGARVSGHVLDASGQAVSGYEVRVALPLPIPPAPTARRRGKSQLRPAGIGPRGAFIERGRLIRRTRTDEHGRFELDGVPPSQGVTLEVTGLAATVCQDAWPGQATTVVLDSSHGRESPRDGRH
jgi:hypothetical protein